MLAFGRTLIYVVEIEIEIEGNSGTSKTKGISLWNVVPNSELI